MTRKPRSKPSLSSLEPTKALPLNCRQMQPMRERDHGASLHHIRATPFKFRGITVQQAIETMTNGSCGD